MYFFLTINTNPFVSLYYVYSSLLNRIRLGREDMRIWGPKASYMYNQI